MRHFIAMVLLCAVGATAHGADTNVSGAWSVSIESQIRPRQTTMQLKQEGQKLTGTLIDARGKPVPVSGTLVGNQITLSYPVTGIEIRTNTPGANPELSMNYAGTVVDGRIAAKANNPLTGEISFNAKRP